MKLVNWKDEKTPVVLEPLYVEQGRKETSAHASEFVVHINPGDRPVFGIEVQAGDLISVPQGTRHWFDLCGDRRIRAIRLFQDTTGWTPHYVADAVHAGYEPLCLGPSMLPGQGPGRAGL